MDISKWTIIILYIVYNPDHDSMWFYSQGILWNEFHEIKAVLFLEYVLFSVNVLYYEQPENKKIVHELHASSVS